MLVVLPSSAPSSLREAYAQFAQAWAADGAGIEIRWDKDLSQLPTDRAAWLMGWENRFLPQIGGGLAAANVTVRNGGDSGQTILVAVLNRPWCLPRVTAALPVRY